MSKALQRLVLHQPEQTPLPSGWEWHRLEDVAVSLRPGKLYDENSVSEEGGVPVVNQTADSFHGFHDEEPGIVASSETPVFTFANHTCAMRLMTRPYSCIQNIFSRVGEPGVTDTAFLYYVTLRRLTLSGYKGHHPIYRKQWIPVPPVPVQLRIASILRAYDYLIENNQRRIQLLEQAGRLLYKEWFVHLRFPGHEDVTITDGVPDGWQKKLLGEIANTNVESYRAGGLPDEINYIDISSVAQGRIVAKDAMLSADAPGRARRKANSGDVIWSNVRPNLRAYALVLDPAENDVFSTGFTVLSPTGIPFSYLYLLVTTDEFVGHLVNHATGASYPAVRPDDFERAIVLTPSKVVLELFHERAEPVNRLISVLDEETRSLAQARDLLLPRLMNGEVAV